MTYDDLTQILDRKYNTSSMQGYYSDDNIHEDLSILPEEGEGFEAYRQCANFELAGKGYQPLNPKHEQESVRIKVNGQTQEEKDLRTEEEIYEYLKSNYSLDLKKT